MIFLVPLTFLTTLALISAVLFVRDCVRFADEIGRDLEGHW